VDAVTDLEALFNAVNALRTEIRADITALTAQMVNRGEHAAQMAALEHRVAALESSRRSVLAGLVYPLLVGLLLAAVGYLIAKGGA
jgi:hypothetical protein